jgi:adenylate kinase
MIRTIFLAPPGAGKGTQAKKLAEVTGAIHVSTGDALRAAVSQKTAAGLKAKKYMDDGDLVPDKVVLQIVQDSLQQGAKTGWILDGFPRNEQQAIALEKILAELKQEKYCVIYFDVSDDALVERIAGRYVEFGRSDDNPSIVPNRLQVYRDQTSCLINFYTQRKALHTIDGNRSVEHIFEELQTLAEKCSF